MRSWLLINSPWLFWTLLHFFHNNHRNKGNSFIVRLILLIDDVWWIDPRLDIRSTADGVPTTLLSSSEMVLGGGDPAGLFRGSSIAVWYQFNGWWLPIEKDVNWIRFHPRRTEKAARGQHRDKNECFPFEKNILKMLCPILARVSNVPMLGPENLVPKYGSHSARNFNQIAIRRRGRLSIQLSVSLKP